MVVGLFGPFRPAGLDSPALVVGACRQRGLIQVDDDLFYPPEPPGSLSGADDG